MSMDYLQYERIGSIGVLTVNRPGSFNALNSEVIAQLSRMLETIAEDIRCLILTGAGEKAFVAGADIAEMKDFTSAEAMQFCNEGNAVMEQLEALPIPTIAAVNGYALGGGCELALCCDIRIASETAVFGMPETSLGILPGYGGVQRLTRIVGAPKAKEMLFTCARIPAHTALELGLVNLVVSPADLMTVCREMSDSIAANAPVGVCAAKAVANASIGRTLTDATRLEAELFGRCFDTQDQKEAMTAFVEKRKHAPFTGR